MDLLYGVSACVNGHSLSPSPLTSHVALLPTIKALLLSSHGAAWARAKYINSLHDISSMANDDKKRATVTSLISPLVNTTGQVVDHKFGGRLSHVFLTEGWPLQKDFQVAQSRDQVVIEHLIRGNINEGFTPADLPLREIPGYTKFVMKDRPKDVVILLLDQSDVTTINKSYSYIYKLCIESLGIVHRVPLCVYLTTDASVASWPPHIKNNPVCFFSLPTLTAHAVSIKQAMVSSLSSSPSTTSSSDSKLQAILAWVPFEVPSTYSVDLSFNYWLSITMSPFHSATLRKLPSVPKVTPLEPPPLQLLSPVLDEKEPTSRLEMLTHRSMKKGKKVGEVKSFITKLELAKEAIKAQAAVEIGKAHEKKLWIDECHSQAKIWEHNVTPPTSMPLPELVQLMQDLILHHTHAIADLRAQSEAYQEQLTRWQAHDRDDSITRAVRKYSQEYLELKQEWEEIKIELEQQREKEQSVLNEQRQRDLFNAKQRKELQVTQQKQRSEQEAKEAAKRFQKQRVLDLKHIWLSHYNHIKSITALASSASTVAATETKRMISTGSNGLIDEDKKNEIDSIHPLSHRYRHNINTIQQIHEYIRYTCDAFVHHPNDHTLELRSIVIEGDELGLPHSCWPSPLHHPTSIIIPTGEMSNGIDALISKLIERVTWVGNEMLWSSSMPFIRDPTELTTWLINRTTQLSITLRLMSIISHLHMGGPSQFLGLIKGCSLIRGILRLPTQLGNDYTEMQMHQVQLLHQHVVMMVAAHIDHSSSDTRAAPAAPTVTTSTTSTVVDNKDQSVGQMSLKDWISFAKVYLQQCGWSPIDVVLFSTSYLSYIRTKISSFTLSLSSSSSLASKLIMDDAKHLEITRQINMHMNTVGYHQAPIGIQGLKNKQLQLVREWNDIKIKLRAGCISNEIPIHDIDSCL